FALGRGVDAFAVEGVGGLHPDFAEGGMGVNCVAEFARGEFGADGRGGLGDQLGGVRANGSSAEQLVGGGVGDPLHEADGFAGGESLAETGEAELAGLYGAILLLRVFLVDADRADLRRGEDHIGDDGVVPALFRANGVFGGGDALGGGVMGELDFAGDVADGVDVRGGRAAVVIGFDVAALAGLEAGVFELEAFGDGFAADGAEENVGLEDFVAKTAADGTGAGGDFFERLAGEHADAELLFHVSADFTADIGIEQQEDVLEQFDDGDLDAEHGGHAGEFATDETAAHHDHGAGEFLDVKESAAFDDALMFRQEAGHGGSRAGGDDDLLRRKTGRAAGTGHVEGGAVDEAGGAGELFHAIGGEQRADAAAQLLN